ncbi:MAG: glycosyltransferase family 39 protein [Bryobacteraceae bacterium]
MIADRKLSWERAAVIAVCLVALSFHMVAIGRGSIELDEFQHLHAAWLVSQGQTPYADFFEHHTPLLYYLLAAALPLDDPGFDTIVQARYVALAFTMLAAFAAWLWMKRYGRIEALIVVCLFASNTFLLFTGHTVFVDIHSAPLLILSAFLIAIGEKRPSLMAASGLAFGLAVLFNLKASMAMFAPAALILARGVVAWNSPPLRRSWLRGTVCYGLGGIAAILFVSALLGTSGLDGLWRYVVQMNLAWKGRHSGLRELIGIVWAEPFVCAVAGAAVLHRCWSVYRRRFVLDERDVPALFLASLGLGILLLPVVWKEYFVLVVPFVLLVAAIALGEWFRAGAGDRRFAFVSLGVLAFFGALAVFPYRAIFRGDSLAFVQSAAMIGVFAVLAIAVKHRTGGSWWFQKSICIALISVFPLIRVGTTLDRLDNLDQRKPIEYILANTGAADAVFDGYSGFGVFRPHAYWYWFLHEEVQAMLSEREKTSGIVEALETKRPAFVVYDGWIRALPQEVQTYIQDRYEDTSVENLKRLKAPAP